MRQATEVDRPDVEAFLEANATYMMFAWSNLLRHGMNGEHPRSMQFSYSEGFKDLLGISHEGMVMPFCPNTADDIAPLLVGRNILGILGETGIAERVRRALGLSKAALDTSEPHYDLALSDLQVPNTAGMELRSLKDAPRELLEEWRAAYAIESLAVPGEDAKARAVQDISTYIANDSHRVLFCDGAPVAMTGYNATASHIVQIGGVYTPPNLRSRGYGRAAVAMHLDEARPKGTKRAILFAANVPAEKAYRAIGFRQIGNYSVIIYDQPQHV